MNIVKQLQKLHNKQLENANTANSSVEKCDWSWPSGPEITAIDKLEAYISKYMILWMLGTVTAGLGIGWIFGSFAAAMIGAWLGTMIGALGGCIHAKYTCPNELKQK